MILKLKSSVNCGTQKARSLESQPPRNHGSKIGSDSALFD